MKQQQQVTIFMSLGHFLIQLRLPQMNWLDIWNWAEWRCPSKVFGSISCVRMKPWRTHYNTVMAYFLCVINDGCGTQTPGWNGEFFYLWDSFFSLLPSAQIRLLCSSTDTQLIHISSLRLVQMFSMQKCKYPYELHTIPGLWQNSRNSNLHYFWPM